LGVVHLLGRGTGIGQWSQSLDDSHRFCLVVTLFLMIVVLFILQHCMFSGRGICFMVVVFVQYLRVFVWQRCLFEGSGMLGCPFLWVEARSFWRQWQHHLFGGSGSAICSEAAAATFGRLDLWCGCSANVCTVATMSLGDGGMHCPVAYFSRGGIVWAASS
jgi:hypothetical protein